MCEEMHEQIWANQRDSLSGHWRVLVFVLLGLRWYVDGLVDVYKPTVVQPELTSGVSYRRPLCAPGHARVTCLYESQSYRFPGRQHHLVSSLGSDLVLSQGPEEVDIRADLA